MHKMVTRKMKADSDKGETERACAVTQRRLGQ